MKDALIDAGQVTAAIVGCVLAFAGIAVITVLEQLLGGESELDL